MTSVSRDTTSTIALLPQSWSVQRCDIFEMQVLQKTQNAESDEQYNLGTQSNEDFYTNYDGSVTITYYAHDFVR